MEDPVEGGDARSSVWSGVLATSEEGEEDAAVEWRSRTATLSSTRTLVLCVWMKARCLQRRKGGSGARLGFWWREVAEGDVNSADWGFSFFLFFYFLFPFFFSFFLFFQKLNMKKMRRADLGFL